MAITVNTRPTEAVAAVFTAGSVDTLATKNVSAVLYIAVTIMLMMVGTESDRISFGTGVVVIF